MGAAARDRDALERLLGAPETSWLLERVRARVLAAGDDALSGIVRLDRPSPGERAAAVKLVGPPRRAGSALRIDLGDVEAVLRRGPWPAGLADAVVTLTGPVLDHAAERGREQADWEAVRAGLGESGTRFPGLLAWWESWCAAGGLKRAARAEAARRGVVAGPEVGGRLVGELARLLEAVPAAGVPLAVFARQVVGDAHALDEDRPLGRLAVAVLAVAFAPGAADVDLGRSRRDVWASAGVVMSNVASTALSLGVAGEARVGADTLGTATSTALDAMRAARSPMLLTLDQVRSGGVAPATGDTVVHVCENPTVVEVVASRWSTSGREPGPTGGPVLVCTSGQPSTAVLELLEVLTSGGAPCRYHGDFDWAGIRIAGGLARRVAWTPWRFTVADYRSALGDDPPALPLAGRPAEAPWDPALVTAMTERGLAVEEEAVADLLAEDLVGDLVGGAVDAASGSRSRDGVDPRGG